eukprot:TRINITY_DN18698_c0_g1_i1.p1 TRINITY_DN18698_c0_g1~~TRINITY_DN18698_c0_g1_i1.p1  ORF type:complete len:417 (-),score=40.69 TRINITY_DN18698_c0_g1_i1:1982-3232(-)
MQILNNIKDHRIQAANFLVEVTMQEYLDIAVDILNENEFQRKKVINSQISALLIEDILIGCSIPPLVLAIKKELLDEDFDYNTFENKELIIQAFKEKQLLILDGKQRTHVFAKLHKDLTKNIAAGKNVEESSIKMESFLKNTLRIEVYVGINKLNILYRMLTLNSGQTSMSTRHLMEMLYLDYLDIPFKDIKLIPDKADEKVSNDTTEFQFKDILDGFTSYLDKDENTLDRSEILDNIKSARNIKFEDSSKNLFEEFIICYKKFLDKINQLSGGYTISKEELMGSEFEVKGLLFGTTAIEIFKRSQALSGFGAAVAELKDSRNNFDLSAVSAMIDNISIRDDTNYETSIHYLVKHFDNIRDKSKKIGNDQRFYFKVLFRSIFDPESAYPLFFDRAIEYAYKRTREEKSYLPDVNVR